MNKTTIVLVIALCLVSLSTSEAAFLVEVDTDGMDDGVLTFSSNFTFGGDTSTASQSIPSTAFGMAGGDSIFGGDGSLFPDTYVVKYNPSTEADNLVIPAGADLGEGNFATGATGGGISAPYTVYATWPLTSSVSGGLTRYTVDTDGDSFSVDVNQNDANDLSGTAGRGHVWVNLGAISYTSGDITVTQEAVGDNSFVSMRLAGVLFERAIPEPSSGVLLILAGLNVMAVVRRRRVGDAQ